VENGDIYTGFRAVGQSALASKSKQHGNPANTSRTPMPSESSNHPILSTHFMQIALRQPA
jgi:hypothetical protein